MIYNIRDSNQPDGFEAHLFRENPVIVTYKIIFFPKVENPSNKPTL